MFGRRLPWCAVVALVLVPLSSCGVSDPQVRPSSELRGLLLTTGDYPEDYELTELDHDELNDPWSSWMPSNEFSEVSPSECAEHLENPTAHTAGPYNVEGHVASKEEGDSSLSDPIYSHVLMDGGDIGEGPLAPDSAEAQVEECSEATVTVDEQEGELRMATFELDGMPRDFLGLAVEVSVDGVDSTVRTAVTTVDDVLIATTELVLDDGSPTFETPELSSDDPTERLRELLEDDSVLEEDATPDEEELERLQELMSTAVENVREG
ncbi:ubiquitin-like domain-containing protein [Halostreptopolyspora alba]|uniref:DUF5642 domain-containing protein n=1 Tax=Halostreptopolyspora alba TaxID=2487137 RepID=A0A3N0EG17_9ACTN|nr:hypothetical protein EFW17_02615 [Nocardiopsaceae bacterium YIM 96095]